MVTYKCLGSERDSNTQLCNRGTIGSSNISPNFSKNLYHEWVRTDVAPKETLNYLLSEDLLISIAIEIK